MTSDVTISRCEGFPLTKLRTLKNTWSRYVEPSALTVLTLLSSLCRFSRSASASDIEDRCAPVSIKNFFVTFPGMIFTPFFLCACNSSSDLVTVTQIVGRKSDLFLPSDSPSHFGRGAIAAIKGYRIRGRTLTACNVSLLLSQSMDHSLPFLHHELAGSCVRASPDERVALLPSISSPN